MSDDKIELELPDAAEESGTDRDGVLSYAGEWHALFVGLAAGMVAILTGQYGLLLAVAAAALGIEGLARAGKIRNVKAVGEIRREPWYALAGLVLGAVIGAALGSNLSAVIGF